MNIVQRIILMVGAVALVVALLATPKCLDGGALGGRYKWSECNHEAALMQGRLPDLAWDITLARGAVIVGVTGLACIAARKNKLL